MQRGSREPHDLQTWGDVFSQVKAGKLLDSRRSYIFSSLNAVTYIRQMEKIKNKEPS